MTEAAKSVPLNPCCSDPQRGLGLFESKDGIAQKLPLAGVDIKAAVLDSIVSVTVSETFSNELSEPIEAVYIFPLSGACSVSACELIIGDRVIDAVVKERGQARQDYQDAVQEGRRAALMEQERDNVFTVQVGNVMPNEAVKVKITYSELLTCFEDGATELRLPLVVAPRYISGQGLCRSSVGDGTAADTGAVPDASRITPPLLASGLNPGVNLHIDVTLDLGADEEAEITELTCSQHATKTALGKAGLRISLARECELLNRDFVLRWKNSANQLVRSLGFISKEASEIEGETIHYGMLSIKPPAKKASQLAVRPRDVIFVLDRSGSMDGIKMASAARALTLLLNTLGPKDTFAICAFDDQIEWPCDRGLQSQLHTFLKATPAGIDRGARLLRQIEARGGTEIGAAMDGAYAAFRHRGQSLGRQSVIVLITDGQVGEVGHTFKTVQSNAARVRVFTVGIDTAVNDAFLTRVAKLGGGTCALVAPGDALDAALKQIGRELGNPLVSDLAITGGAGVQLVSQTPTGGIDLYEGRPVSIFFQCAALLTDPTALAEESSFVVVEGRFSDGTAFSERVELQGSDNKALPQLFARSQVADWEDAMRMSSDPDRINDLRRDIVELAVQHSILTRFTAFVAVDQAEVANLEGDTRRLVQPVMQPQDWRMFDGSQTGSAIRQCIRVKGIGSNSSAPLAQQSTGGWGASPACPAAGASLGAQNWPASGLPAPSTGSAQSFSGASWGAPPHLSAWQPAQEQSPPAPDSSSLQERLHKTADSISESVGADALSPMPLKSVYLFKSAEEEEIARTIILLVRFKDLLLRLVKRDGVFRGNEWAEIRDYVRRIREKTARFSATQFAPSMRQFDRQRLQPILLLIEDPKSQAADVKLACETCVAGIEQLRFEFLDSFLPVAAAANVKGNDFKGSDPFWFGNV